MKEKDFSTLLATNPTVDKILYQTPAQFRNP